MVLGFQHSVHFHWFSLSIDLMEVLAACYRANAQISEEHISKNSMVWWQPAELGVSGGLSSKSIVSSKYNKAI